MSLCPHCGIRHERADASCEPRLESTVTSDPLVGRVVGGQYRIERPLARGAMGVVYLALHEKLGRRVAVKLLQLSSTSTTTAASAERFRREALTLARLSHPNIVRVHDFGQDQDVAAYLVMELVDGPSLASEIARRGAFPLDDVCRIVAQIADALDAAHARDIVHRDIKPANVLIERGGRVEIVKVVDFGIAALLSPEIEPSPGLTASGVILGTPLYLSPEQCNAEPVEARSDVYSLGCVAFELLTGRTPFSGPSLLAILNKHAGDPPPRASDFAEVPRAIDPILQSALAKQPSDRPASAGAFARDLIDSVRSSIPSRASAVSTDHSASTVSRAATGPSGNLPAPMTAIVGRDGDVTDLADRLQSARLLTLVGIGGIGKTRLAVEVATESSGRYGDGVWFADLAPIHVSADVASTVSQALGVREVSGVPLETTIIAELRTKQSLLILDNCEQVIEAAAALVSSILAGCPAVRVLATSRETLGVTGEIVSAVGPLPLPSRSVEGLSDLDDAAASRLFMERLRRHNPTLELRDRNASAIAQICIRLEGIPLAIELAAARSRVLSIDQILERLDNRFTLLRSTSRSSMPRQQTLRATIDWSYDLLTDDERTMLGRLAVFVGGWTLNAAEAVCSDERLESRSVLDVLTRLVEKSLVVTEEQPEGVRFGMLETIRQYAIEKLREGGDEPVLHDRHAKWCAERIAGARSRLYVPGAMGAILELDREIDNFRAAMRRSLMPRGDFESAVSIAAGLTRLWEVTARNREAATWLSQMTDRSDSLPLPMQAAFARARAWNARLCGELTDSVAWSRRAVEVAREIGDGIGEGDGLTGLSAALQLLGDFDQAWQVGLDALHTFERIGHTHGLRGTFNQLGLMASDRCEFAEAEIWLTRSLESGLATGDDRFAMISMLNLTLASLYSGDLPKARERLMETSRLFERFPDVVFGGRLNLLSGAVAAAHGEFDEATTRFREALRIGRDVEDPITMINGLEHFAEVFLRTERPAVALRCIAAASMARGSAAVASPPSVGKFVGRMRLEAVAALGRERAGDASRDGAAMQLEEAVAYASAQ